MPPCSDYFLALQITVAIGCILFLLMSVWVSRLSTRINRLSGMVHGRDEKGRFTKIQDL